MTPFDIMVDVLAERQLAGGFRAALEGGDAHEVFLHRDADSIGHFRKERNDALENADQNRALAAVILRNLCANLFDPRVDLLLGNKNAFNVLKHVRFVNHTANPLSLILLF